MEEQTKVDKDYLESFNQGYEVAKELGLKSDALEGINAGNNRIQAMKDGIEQYNKEQTLEKDIIPPFDMDSIDKSYIDISDPKKDKDKGMDMDL
ncbi:hypothetical protein Q4Q34_08540 [Flavivirga abyssicola]|uniref:hypothetical protein n=1 Tax=Flavivirga abyssicola TaxID=3063533 RepID=UPI0026E048D2|nr:hypothetical protein [Flavivirga sp. MEBiC07777]WVK15075.1 hypothetical protein Q4Q34_08540 [Flavivirga sp. MEBiC07777]